MTDFIYNWGYPIVALMIFIGVVIWNAWCDCGFEDEPEAWICIPILCAAWGVVLPCMVVYGIFRGLHKLVRYVKTLTKR